MFCRKICFRFFSFCIVLFVGAVTVAVADVVSSSEVKKPVQEKTAGEYYKEIYQDHKTGLYGSVIEKYEIVQTVFDHQPYSLGDTEQVFSGIPALLTGCYGEALYYTGQKDKARTVFKYLENHTSVGKNLELKKGSQSDVEKDKIPQSEIISDFSYPTWKTFYWLGLLSMEKGDLEVAVTYFFNAGVSLKSVYKTSSEAENLYYKTLFCLSESLLALDKAQDAVPVLEFLQFTPFQNQKGVYELLAEAYYDTKNYTNLTELYEAQQSNNAKDKTTLYVAEAYGKLGNWEKSGDLYLSLIAGEDSAKDVSLKALQSAWTLIEENKEKSIPFTQDMVLQAAGKQAENYPLMMAELWLMVGRDKYIQEDYTGAEETFLLAYGMLEKNKNGQDVDWVTLYYYCKVYLAQTHIKKLQFDSQVDTLAENLKNLTTFSRLYDEVLEQQKKIGNTTLMPVENLIVNSLVYYSFATEHWQEAVIYGEKAQESLQNLVIVATGYYNLGKYSHAVKTVEKIFAKELPIPDSLKESVYRLYAMALLQSGAEQKGLDVFEQLYTQGILSEEGKLEYGKALLGKGDSTLAYEVLTPIEGSAACYLKGLVAVNLQKWKEAERYFSECKANVTDKEKSYVLFYLGYAQFVLEKYEESFKTLETFSQLYPYHRLTQKAINTQMTCALHLSQEKKDKQWLTEAGALGEKLIAAATSEKEKEQFLLTTAEIYKSTEEYDKVFELLNPYSKGQKDINYRVQLFLGEIYVSRGDYAKALDLYDSLARAAGNREIKEIALYRQGFLYFSEGHYEMASDIFTRYIRSFPSGSYGDGALYYKGECLKYMNQADLAILQYENLLSNYPEGTYRYNSLVSLVTLYTDKGEYDKALEYATILTKDYKEYDHEDMIRELDLLRQGMGKNTVSLLTEYKKVGELTTESGRQRALELGKLYLASVNTENQGESLLQDLVAYYKKIVSDSNVSDSTENNTIPLSPTDTRTAGEASFTLGECYRNKNQNEKAGELFLESAFYFSFSDTERAAAALYRSAESYEAAGFTGDAVSIVETLQELYPNSSWVQLGKSLLKLQ